MTQEAYEAGVRAYLEWKRKRREWLRAHGVLPILGNTSVPTPFDAKMIAWLVRCREAWVAKHGLPYEGYLSPTAIG